MKPYYEHKGIQIFHGDCLDKMRYIPDNSIDMVMCDPPYGTTACAWDSIIPLEPMWAHLKRVIKPNGAIVLTASQPFTTTLISSNMGMFKYCWVYRKALPTGHLNAKKMPMRGTEDVAVFYEKHPTYNPQKTTGHNRKVAHAKYKKEGLGEQCYGKENRDTHYDSTERYPTGIIEFNNAKQSAKIHPTQKPVALMKYLINTYTNRGDTVLDFAMGSGTTLVAAKRYERKCIGIELEKKYVDITIQRLAQGILPL